jgi:membrane protease YdiL (CAAX protease family)
LFFLATGVWEEALFRGVLIRNASEGLGGLGWSPTTAISTALVVSMVIFGGLHVFAGLGSEAIPLWAVVLQGIVAGAYFGLAYCLTGSLALPVGIHFGANFTDAVLLGGMVEPYASYPALLRLEWSIPEAWILPKGFALPLTLFVLLATVAWVRWTRGAVRFDPSLVEAASQGRDR